MRWCRGIYQSRSDFKAALVNNSGSAGGRRDLAVEAFFHGRDNLVAISDVLQVIETGQARHGYAATVRIEGAVGIEVHVGSPVESLALVTNANLYRIGMYVKFELDESADVLARVCLLYTSPSPRDGLLSRMPSSA